MLMDPRTSIPPTRLVKRWGQKRWHMDAGVKGAPSTRTVCGQSIHNPVRKTGYNAQEIDCTDCMVQAISNARSVGQGEQS